LFGAITRHLISESVEETILQNTTPMAYRWGAEGAIVKEGGIWTDEKEKREETTEKKTKKEKNKGIIIISYPPS